MRVGRVATATVSVGLLSLAAGNAAWSLVQGGQLFPLPVNGFALAVGALLCVKWRADVREDRRRESVPVHATAIPTETIEGDFEVILRMFLDHADD